MCGFVGFLCKDHNNDIDLDQWSEIIAHRGPDQFGNMSSGSFGIGTRRLSIQDLSAAGDQPMQSDRYVLGFNGEIYNHHELRDRLRAEGFSEFKSGSDTETLLQAFEHWGIPETLEALNGMYSIALWDKQSRELSLVRDPLGVKPVYYIELNGAVYFASEIKALLPFTGTRISRDGVALYLYFGFVPAPYSLIEDIRKVRPSERVIFTAEGHAQSEVIVPLAWKRPVNLATTYAERVQQLRGQVEQAIHRQLISDVPVGVFLSGGIDSTIIASVASRQNPGMSSFSLKPDATEDNPGASTDAELARELATTLKLTHHEVTFGPSELLERLDENIGNIDEPVAEIYAIAEQILSERARENGVNVVLTGHGGDEVFMGYPTYAAVFRGDVYNQIPWFGPAARFVAGTSLVSADMQENLMGAASIWRQSPLERYQTVSGVHFSAEHAAQHAGIEPGHLNVLLDGIFTDTRARVCLLPRSEGTRNAELFSRMDLLLMVPEHYNTRLDRMTMTASIEARVPFQDLELIGFISHIGHRDLLRGGLKGMLREAFTAEIPERVRNRSKQTFQAPMSSWMNSHLDCWIKRHTPELVTSYGNTDVPRARTSEKLAYQTWSLALLEGWRHAMGLEY
jgi:asparagine synthase (glutamine-hydrolysing)